MYYVCIHDSLITESLKCNKTLSKEDKTLRTITAEYFKLILLLTFVQKSHTDALKCSFIKNIEINEFTSVLLLQH